MSQTNPINAALHSLCLTSILIFYSDARLDLQSGLFYSGFFIKPLQAFLLSLVHAACLAQLILLDSIALNLELSVLEKT
jgi:hypothetical protein